MTASVINEDLSQANARVVYLVASLGYVVWLASTGVEIVAAVYWFVGIGQLYAMTTWILAKRPQECGPVVRHIRVVGDLTLITLLLYYLGEWASPFYFIYLWIIIGNGIRFGKHYLNFGIVVGVVYFTWVTHYAPYWSNNSHLSAGLLAGVIILPLFFHSVIDRLHGAVANLHSANAELEKVHAAKDEFLASMSHELRTPLTSIIGNSQFLLEQNYPDEVRTIFKDIESAGNTQLALVNDILDMSKIESGKFTIEEAPYNLTAMLGEVERMLVVRAKDAGNRLVVTQQQEQQSYLIGDAQRIAQVLINFLSNAIKFTSKGEVRLTVWNDSSTLFFAVKDSGIGMSPETLARLFKPFEQADGSISKRFGGTGLGLFISYNLARLMGGTIQVESREGVGSTFTLKIPYMVTAQSIEQVDQQAVSQGEASAKLSGSVLIAEDTPELQLLERRILESMGVAVTLANNGREAVELAQAASFDLILMDMQMPEMDGIEATRALRDLGDTTPIVPLTANVMQKHRELFVELGCDDFLGKPIDKQELSRVLRCYLVSETSVAAAPEISDELMQLFFNGLIKKKQNLMDGLTQLNWQLIQDTAHTIKGSAPSFGYPLLSESATELEQMIEQKEMELVTTVVMRLVAEIDQVLTDSKVPD